MKQKYESRQEQQQEQDEQEAIKERIKAKESSSTTQHHACAWSAHLSGWVGGARAVCCCFSPQMPQKKKKTRKMAAPMASAGVAGCFNGGIAGDLR